MTQLLARAHVAMAMTMVAMVVTTLAITQVSERLKTHALAQVQLSSPHARFLALCL